MTAAVSGPGDLRVLHVDLDAFFAAVEQRQRPSLRGKPVVVGGTSGRGVVATASYEARQYGIGSAMAMEHARRACPHAMFLSPRFTAYREHSVAALAWLAEAGCTVEQIAFDEAFVDLRTVPAHWWDRPARTSTSPSPDVPHPDLHRLAARVRSTIWSRTGLSSAVGVGRTKLTAKLASEQGKPGGVTVLDATAEERILPVLAVRALWGVGPATADRLRGYGVNTVADLRAMDEADLRALLGRAHGALLYNLARGIDPREVSGDSERKSVGAEHTLPHDVQSRAQLEDALKVAFTDAHTRLRRAGMAARSVTVKVRYADFATVTRSATLGSPADDVEQLLEAALRAADRGIDVARGVRLVGVSFSALSDHAQLPISFTGTTEQTTTTEPAPEPGSLQTETGLVDVREQVAGVPVTASNAAPGLDIAHPTLGRGWLVRGASDGSVVVRFEGPDTPAAPDREFDLTRAGLVTAPPAPPSAPKPLS